MPRRRRTDDTDPIVAIAWVAGILFATFIATALWVELIRTLNHEEIHDARDSGHHPAGRFNEDRRSGRLRPVLR